MKTQCPHCDKFYEVEEELAEEIVKCPGCKEEFFVEKYVEPKPRRIYKFLILKFEDVEDTINQFAADDWEVISHSTVFLSENSGGLWGVSAGTREKKNISNEIKIPLAYHHNRNTGAHRRRNIYCPSPEMLSRSR